MVVVLLPLVLFGNILGRTRCKPCEAGTFQDKKGQTSCNECPDGTYAGNTHFEKCIKCPFRLNSSKGSDGCPFCARDFYLNNTRSENILTTDIFENPSQYCLRCPSKASCQVNTTLQNIVINPNYWRHSQNTSRLYHCERSKTCIAASKETKCVDDSCSGNHTGPLCEVCTEDNHYFNIDARQCIECPPLSWLAFKELGIFLVVALVVTVLTFIANKRVDLISSLSLRAKAKLIVSFYQIFATFKDVYGVSIKSENLLYIDRYMSLDIIQITGIPLNCMSTFQQQLIFRAIWPYIIVILGGFFVYIMNWIKRAWTTNCCNNEGQLVILNHDGIIRQVKMWIIKWSVIIFYFALPMVSKSIFDARKCQAFQIDDLDPPNFDSYLVEDMRVKCDENDSNYENILSIFWVLFVTWAVLTPMGFLWLLKNIRRSVQSNSIEALADTCRFLWMDYTKAMWFWDIVDTLRKLILCGYVILIDPKEGSNKMLRLVVAILVSLLYHSLLLAFRPYRRNDDYNLAFLSNYLLIGCFSLGIILKLCDNEHEEGNGKGNATCTRFIGLSFDSVKATIVVVSAVLGIFIITIALVVFLTVNKIRSPTVRMISTGYVPILELPESCSFHVFMSHTWSTGQARTHSIARKMQLYLGGLKVWLDVDQLNDTSRLEEWIKASVVIVIYYSKNYFKSKNCRREIYAAIELKKPIILLYEGNQTVIEEIKEECIRYCKGNGVNEPTATCILEKLFGGDDMSSDNTPQRPILWLKEGNFSAAALNQIYTRVISYLPHYRRHPQQLRQGIKVPGELGDVSLQSPINLLVYKKNQGCSDLAEELELKMKFGGRRSSLINVFDVASFLQIGSNKSKSHNLNSDRDNNEVINEINTSPISQSRSNDNTSNILSGMEDDEEFCRGEFQALEPLISNKLPTFLLIYLNKHTFEEEMQYQDEMTTIFKSCIENPDISIVLVHEQDVSKGGCEFDDFFNEAPEELINPPYQLFKDIAIPLYFPEEYRDVSLRQILCKMGAIPLVSGSERLIMTLKY